MLKRISLTWMVNFTLLEVVLYLLNLDLYSFLFRWRSDQELHAASAAQANKSVRSRLCHLWCAVCLYALFYRILSDQCHHDQLATSSIMQLNLQRDHV